METKVLFMIAVFFIVAAALFYFVFNLYSAPYSYTFPPATVHVGASSEGGECTSGQQAQCKTPQGCPGERECLHGYWSACVLVPQCNKGDVEVCEVDSCKDGYRSCGNCSQWNACEPRNASDADECGVNSTTFSTCNDSSI